jgi:hypothetical protein
LTFEFTTPYKAAEFLLGLVGLLGLILCFN